MKFLLYDIHFIIIAAVFFHSGKLFAADPVPGSACSVNNAHMRSGGPENSGVVYDMTCQGGVWVGTMTYGTSGNIGVGTASPTSGAILDVSGSGTSQSAMIVPRDTTANRPTGVEGMIRYNTTKKAIETYQGGTPAWGTIPSEVAVVDVTGQSSAIGATAIFTPTADAPYLICAQEIITTPGTSGNLKLDIKFASESGATSHTETLISTIIGFVQNASRNCSSFYITTANSLRYQTVFTGTPGAVVYNLHIRIYRLD